MSEYFAHKVVVVTGATSGIGRATVHALCRKGASVVAASRNDASLKTLQQELPNTAGKYLGVRTDVTDRAQVEQLMRAAVERFGTVDVVVCSAGVYLRRPIRELTFADYERVMAINFYGVLYCIHAVLPLMLKQRSGSIAVVSSIDGKKGLPPDGAYVASKFAINGVLDVLRQELRGTGVFVSTVLPARVDTPMIAHLKVPAVSPKIPSERVAKALLCAIRRKKAETVVPYWGPKTLVILSALSARVGDWLVRTFGLEGREEN